MSRRIIVPLAVLMALLAMSGLLYGCASSNSAVGSADVYVPPAEGQTKDSGSETEKIPDLDLSADRKIIYTAQMRFVCDEPGDALRFFTDKAEELGGYVAASSSDTQGSSRVTSAQITLRLPSGTLEAFRDYAAGLGSVRSFEMNSDDITDEYYDLDARLTQAKAQEQQLLTFMEQAETIEDTLRVYEELGNIREEIDVMEGRRRMWDKQVAYSTLTISITATPSYVEDSPEFIRVIAMSDAWQLARRGFINVGRGTLNFISWLFIAIGWLLIPGAIVGGILLLVRFLRRRRMSKPAKSPMPPQRPGE
ncbi:MAG: DUF4349 domain-containing protein [Christensenellales bacterium]|jgi:hypothetical protein